MALITFTALTKRWLGARLAALLLVLALFAVVLGQSSSQPMPDAAQQGFAQAFATADICGSPGGSAEHCPHPCCHFTASPALTVPGAVSHPQTFAAAAYPTQAQTRLACFTPPGAASRAACFALIPLPFQTSDRRNP